MLKSALLALAAILAASPAAAADTAARWRQEAASTTIVRDDWGVPHVHGRTDADAVFGLAYAQAEDDFNRVETNYINALGRLSETEGDSAIWRDLRMKLFIDPAALKAGYASSPPWLKALMVAWADGLNAYLAAHPGVKPRVIRHFEPWMALSFSEGSISGDIERVSLSDLEAFYGGGLPRRLASNEASGPVEPTGSNGIAIAPSRTQDHHALLLINPHTSLFFRAEAQATSDQGLDAYGAVTWGQFFIYQGFNAHAGWMHTSSGLDAVDEFAETIVRRGGRLFYRYGDRLRPVTVSTIAVPYRTASGAMARRSFTVYRTHHGPIVRQADGRWIAVALMNRPVQALEQSFLGAKATDYGSFIKVAELKANSTNNTIFADDKGEIAYLHPQFIPRRDDRFDYTRPVDGSDPATDWKGLLPLEAAPHVLNPKTGWVFNTNDGPWSAAGPDSPKRADFPRYMDTAGENPRGVHAMRLLEAWSTYTLADLVEDAFDPYMPAFAKLTPMLIDAYDAAADDDPLKSELSTQMDILRLWDFRWSADSIPTSLAMFWGENLWARAEPEARRTGESAYDVMARIPPEEKLQAMAEAVDRLSADFGSWRTPWGQINRFQRLNGDIVQTFRDDGPSIAVPFTYGRWGSLASFSSRAYPGTKRWYGTGGNGFEAAVEFGPRVHAVAVAAGGESGHPGSPHFDDQALRYSQGALREVYFYPDQLVGHTERTYHPGG